MRSEEVQVVQAVVDRLTSYQSTAPAGTVERELREALAEADVTLSEPDVRRLVDAVEGADATVDVSALLG